VLGYILWTWALSRASASSVSSFLYAQQLLASVIAWFWLGQTLGALVVAGGVLAIGGVILTIRGAAVGRTVPVVQPAAPRCGNPATVRC
jgi:drug/metabolite transporter (DMT)-like permease